LVVYLLANFVVLVNYLHSFCKGLDDVALEKE